MMNSPYINEARAYAATAHGTHRYGADSYLRHLDEVAQLVAYVCTAIEKEVNPTGVRVAAPDGPTITEVCVMAAYLHDTQEDCPGAGVEQFLAKHPEWPGGYEQYGWKMALSRIVTYVTADPELHTRKAKMEATVALILARIQSADPWQHVAGHLALFIKLCDRLCNMRECLRTGDARRWQMYLREVPLMQQLTRNMRGTISESAPWLAMSPAHTTGALACIAIPQPLPVLPKRSFAFIAENFFRSSLLDQVALKMGTPVTGFFLYFIERSAPWQRAMDACYPIPWDTTVGPAHAGLFV